MSSFLLLSRMRPIRNFLAGYQREHGYPPTMREMAYALSINVSSLQGALRYMASQRVVAYRGCHKPRTYYLINEPHPQDW
jgi:hypothetical protein